MATNFCLPIKTHVIYGYAAVPTGKKAVFEAGARSFSC
jgi:hypothetical protein